MDHNDIPVERYFTWREVIVLGLTIAAGIGIGYACAAACVFHTCGV